jgi:hypothetical protein
MQRLLRVLLALPEPKDNKAVAAKPLLLLLEQPVNSSVPSSKA